MATSCPGQHVNPTLGQQSQLIHRWLQRGRVWRIGTVCSQNIVLNLITGDTEASATVTYCREDTVEPSYVSLQSYSITQVTQFTQVNLKAYVANNPDS